MDSIIEIELLGQIYTLKTELDASQARAVIAYVMKKVDTIATESCGRSKLDTIILAALDIANDFLEIQQKHSALIDDVTSRSQFLIHKLETGRF